MTSKPLTEPVWLSHNGTAYPLVDMSETHLANAIACVERGDPRYASAGHKALLPWMRAELGEKRRSDFSVAAARARARASGRDHHAEFLAAKAHIPATRGPIIGTDVNGCAVYAPPGTPTISGIDDRAGRAHRRIDGIEERLWALERGAVPIKRPSEAHYGAAMGAALVKRHTRDAHTRDAVQYWHVFGVTP